MIWHDGLVIPEDRLRVGVDDRAFEHGLGLFETFRSWDGRAPLLARHLERLRSSARELGIPLEGVRLPGREAVATLVEASGPGGDAMLRLTVTAGSASGRPPVAWMTVRPLPEPEPRPLLVVSEEGARPSIVHDHKMLNYWHRRVNYERAIGLGVAEILLATEGGRLLEGSRNNVLIVPGGRPRAIATPALDHGPVLAGVMRRVALDFAADHGYEVEERVVDRRELAGAEAVFLTNSVRGVRPVDSIDCRRINNKANLDLILVFTEKLPRFLRDSRDLDEPSP